MAIRNGIGEVVSVDATGTLVTLPGARKISIYNAGTNVVYAMVDSPLATLVAAVTAGTALPIPASSAYVFEEDTRVQTYNTVAVACVTGETATAYVGGN